MSFSTLYARPYTKTLTPKAYNSVHSLKFQIVDQGHPLKYFSVLERKRCQGYQDQLFNTLFSWGIWTSGW